MGREGKGGQEKKGKGEEGRGKAGGKKREGTPIEIKGRPNQNPKYATVVELLFLETFLSSVPALFLHTPSECFLVKIFEKCFNCYVICVDLR